ncbi:MAG: hypothetical protein IIA98_09595 [Proteobacteria bacterium]|nr:hypothetical protein [Pseudomonadota bacterium]
MPQLQKNQLSGRAHREKLLTLENEMRKHPQLDVPITHHFAPGVYAREMRVPAGTLLTGKIHKTEHLNIISQGHFSVSNLGETKHIYAPCTFVSPAGTKRAIYAHEDSTWTTIHVTEETNLTALENEIIAESFEAIEGPLIDRQDHQLFMDEFGITEELADEVTNTGEVLHLPCNGFEVRDSDIDGKGLFATKIFGEGETIAPALLDMQKTELGRYTNHAAYPNAKMVVRDAANIDLVALREIDNVEITVNYRAVLDEVSK